MERTKQINTAQNVQVKFHQYLYQIKDYFILPEFKAARDIPRGILSSGSVIVNQIARAIPEPTTHKMTTERCYRNLRHRNLQERLQAQIIQQQCSRLDKESLHIVDESNIVK